MEWEPRGAISHFNTPAAVLSRLERKENYAYITMNLPYITHAVCFLSRFTRWNSSIAIGHLNVLYGFHRAYWAFHTGERELRLTFSPSGPRAVIGFISI